MDSTSLVATRELPFDCRSGGVMLVEVAPDHLQIARVRPEEEIRNRADPGDQAEQEIEADIAGHAGQLPFRHAEVLSLPDDVGAESGAGDVADTGDQIENDVEADRLVGARDDDDPLEELFHRLDALAHRLRIGANLRKGYAIPWKRHQSLPGCCCRSV